MKNYLELLVDPAFQFVGISTEILVPRETRIKIYRMSLYDKLKQVCCLFFNVAKIAVCQWKIQMTKKVNKRPWLTQSSTLRRFNRAGNQIAWLDYFIVLHLPPAVFELLSSQSCCCFELMVPKRKRINLVARVTKQVAPRRERPSVPCYKVFFSFDSCLKRFRFN